ncbi:MAG: hypothetical protein C4326_01930 [Ignavibacteria bacterium]
MRQRLLLLVVVASVGGIAADSRAQISIFPYHQTFDSVQPPALPAGWRSSRNRDSTTNDFVTSTTNPYSPPHAVVTTNARVSQTLFSPLFDFSTAVPESIVFRVARSSTHTARMLIEVSTDSGATFATQIGDSIRNPGVTSYIRLAFALPPTTRGRRGVQLRWRIIGDPTAGATATLRMDDILVTALRTNDLSAGALRFQPASPTEGDSVTAHAKIINLGQQSALSFLAEFYVDANNDSLPQLSELRASVGNATPLAPSDSAELSASIGILDPGIRLVMVKVVYPPDQNLANNMRIAPLTVGYRTGSLVINEILYAPTSPEPEWVEVFNTRSDSISLKNWFIADSSRVQRRITTQEIKVPPQGYLLLTGNPSALLNIHPSVTAAIIGVSSFPSLNNAGDAVILYDGRGVAMDSVRYFASWGGNTGGRSLERVDPLALSNVRQNWGTSRSVNRSTPGERNTLARKDRDLSLDSLSFAPLLPLIDDSIVVILLVKNRGRELSAPFTVELFEDANADSLPQPFERIAVLVVATPLAPLDSTPVVLSIGRATVGPHTIIGRVEMPSDEDTTNNTRSKVLRVGVPPGSVVINEIMYAPTTGMPEWIELFNTRTDTVRIHRWLIGNRSASRYELPADAILAPQQWLVVSKDTALLHAVYPRLSGNIVQVTSLPTFLWNNSSDAVVLLDDRRVMMDSVLYRSSWGGVGGRSLERLDPFDPSNDSTNWASSVDSLGATPARANSHVVMDHDLKVVRIVSDTVLPGENAHLSVVVQNIGRRSTQSFEILLYDDADGDSIGSPAEVFAQQAIAQSLARRESVLVAVEWQTPASGTHAVLAHVRYSLDQRIANNQAWTSVRVAYPARAVVLNEIMYAPFTDNAEFIELNNTSTVPIDLKGWTVRDRLTREGSAHVFSLSSRKMIVQPGEFFVLASDSSVLRRFPLLDTVRLSIVNASSLSLNNDGDDVVLIDPSGHVIDSISYVPAWHNPNIADVTGRSLEKIQPQLASHDGRNWTTCVRPEGGTPGSRNSVYVATLPSFSNIAIAPNPFSPDGDGRDDVAVIHYEMPLTVAMIRVRIYDAVGRRIRTLASNEPSGARGTLVWDGLDDDKRRARVGIYIVFLEAIDDRGGVVETAKAVVVVAAKL